MSEDSSEEILTGRIGNEAAAGWSQMVSSDPVKPDIEETPLEADHPTIKHLSRDAEPLEPVSRKYYGPDGEETPERQSVSPEQAAHDISNARRAEQKALDDQQNSDLVDALNTLHAQEQGRQPTQQDRQPSPELEVQPELDPDAAYAQAQATIAEGDAEVAKFLENPFVRERVEREFSAVTENAAAQVQQAKQTYEAGLAHNAIAGLAALNASFPELSGMNAEQIQGALRLMQPQRAEQYRQHVGLVTNLIAAHQQQAQQERAQQQAYMAQQQAQAAEAFRRFAEEHDAKALAKEAPENLPRIRNLIIEDAKRAGISETELYQAWNSVPALRHSFVAELLADGAKWRLSQRNLAQHRANPVPKVQRPGVASDGPRADDGDLAAASARFNLPGGAEGQAGIRNAAAWLSAKRARG